MSGVNALLAAMAGGKNPAGGKTGVMLGTIKQGGAETIRLLANGLEHSRDDLWITDGLLNSLEKGDAVLVFTSDAQLYYIIAKVVKA